MVIHLLYETDKLLIITKLVLSDREITNNLYNFAANLINVF